MSDDIHDLAKKMLQKAAGKGDKEPNVAAPKNRYKGPSAANKKQAKKVGLDPETGEDESLENGSAPESEPMGAPPKSFKPKTQVTNEMSGPDADLMNEVQKFAPKKKAASLSEASDGPPPPPAMSKAARKAPKPAKSADPELSPRHQELLDEMGPGGSRVNPEMESNPFGQLEQDLPKGGRQMRLAPDDDMGVAPPANSPPGGGNAFGGPAWHGPATVGSIAAQLALQSMPNGERSDVPGGSLEANDESKLSQMTMPSAHTQAGFKPGFNPVATEVGNRGGLPQNMKQPGGENGSFRVGKGSPKDLMDHLASQKDAGEAQAFAEELRRNFPDQITK